MRHFANVLMCLVFASCSVTWVHAQTIRVMQGSGPVCDTAEQMEQVVTGQSFGQVNKDKAACGMVQVLYVKGREVKKVIRGEKVFAITEIAVVGIYANGLLMRTRPFIQYTPFKTSDKPI